MESDASPFPNWETLNQWQPPARPSRRWVKRVWKPIRAPQAELSHWLRHTDARFSKELARGLKKWNLIASEWEALRQMYNPARTSPLAMARALAMTKGGASKLIDRLIKKGLVEKQVASSDRRCRAVGLTRAGKRLVPCLAKLVVNTERRFFDRLTTYGRHGLMDDLKVIVGAAHRKYLKTWVSASGGGGQWAYERTGWFQPSS
jgi:DNA-binding MarR family transcriptional regulator